jgi:predicted Fe-Mo cluster-binding NifX family protein
MKEMHIAIGTTDGTAVCDHLARSAAFIVFEVQDGRAISKSVRDRRQGPCGNHASFVEMLDGCRAVLCGGIGQGAADSLQAHGIEPVVLASRHSVDEAIALYLDGKLATTNERICLCH